MKDRQKLLDSKIFYFALFSVSAMTVLGSTAIAPALPNLEKHFLGIKNIEFLVKLILTIPAIFIVFFSPISGYLFDRYNRLKLIYPAIIIWSISGVSGFFLDNVYHILISRAIFGIATGGLLHWYQTREGTTISKFLYRFWWSIISHYGWIFVKHKLEIPIFGIYSWICNFHFCIYYFI